MEISSEIDKETRNIAKDFSAGELRKFSTKSEEFDLLEFRFHRNMLSFKKNIISNTIFKTSKINEEKQILQENIADFGVKINNLRKTYTDYLDSIQKPIEKSLSYYNHKLSQIILPQIISVNLIMIDLNKGIQDIPRIIEEMKKQARKECANDENEIVLTEAKFRNMEVRERQEQEEINSIETTIEAENKEIEGLSISIDELKEKHKRIDALNKSIEKLKNESANSKKKIDQSRREQASLKEINEELAANLNALQEEQIMKQQECEDLKRIVSSLQSKTKFLKGKATVHDLETNEAFREDISSLAFIVEKEKISNAIIENQQILSDHLKYQEQITTDIKNISEGTKAKDDLSDRLSKIESELNALEEKENEQLIQLDSIRKELQNNEKQNDVMIETLNKTLQEKLDEKAKLEEIIFNAGNKSAAEETNDSGHKLKRKSHFHNSQKSKEDAVRSGNAVPHPFKRQKIDTSKELDLEISNQRPSYMAHRIFNFPVKIVGEKTYSADETLTSDDDF